MTKAEIQKQFRRILEEQHGEPSLRKYAGSEMEALCIQVIQEQLSQLKPQEENQIQKYMLKNKLEYAKKCGCERCKEIVNEYKAELTNKQKQ